MAGIATCLIVGVSMLLFRGETTLAIAAFALSKGVESFSDVVYGFWQQQERMELIAKSLMMRGVLALVAAAVCFVAFHVVWIAVCGMAAAWALVFAGYDLPRGIALAKELDEPVVMRFSALRMKRLIRVSLPLGVIAMLLSFNANVPRYMIGHFRSVKELGIFSALSYILIAGTIVVTALGQSATPRLAQYAAQGKIEFRALSLRLILTGSCWESVACCIIGVWPTNRHSGLLETSMHNNIACSYG